VGQGATTGSDAVLLIQLLPRAGEASLEHKRWMGSGGVEPHSLTPFAPCFDRPHDTTTSLAVAREL